MTPAEALAEDYRVLGFSPARPRAGRCTASGCGARGVRDGWPSWPALPPGATARVAGLVTIVQSRRRPTGCAS